MKKCFPLLGAAWLLASPPFLPAQQLNPEEARDVLRQLSDVQAQREELMEKGVLGALQRIRAAAASESAAREFYEQAILQTQFAGQSREQTQLRDWKKRREDALKGTAVSTALRLHLNYLALTLERASGKTNDDLLPALLKHASLVLAADESLQTDDRAQRDILNSLLRESVAESVFATWLRLKDYIGKVEQWEMSAGNAEGIYAQSVLPKLREKKDPQLLQYWNSRIERETARAAKSGRTFDEENFTAVTLPRLLWQRAQDERILGRTSASVNQMLAVIKKNPGHPEAERWIEQLTGIVKQTATPTAGPDTDTVVPAASPAPPDSPAS